MSRILEEVKAPAEEHEETIVGETKADTFKRLAVKRMNNALDKIRLVGNLSNTAQYEYTEEQIAAIEAALTSQIAEIMNKFRKVKKAKQEFTL